MLSGGMKQRAAFCRAVLADPQLLLLDEPFGALDALTREELSLELSRLWQDLGRTALLITHDIEEAILLGDRVIVMSNRPGRIRLDIPVDLPRPRDVNTEKHPRFMEIKQIARNCCSAASGTERHGCGLKSDFSRATTPLIYLVLTILWETGARGSFMFRAGSFPRRPPSLPWRIEWAPELLYNSYVTLRETVVGFVLALGLSVPLAVIIAFTSRRGGCSIRSCSGLQSVPKVALAPLVILWLGIGNWPKIVIVILVCFFPILVNVVAGFEAVPKPMLDLMHSLRASKLAIFRRLRAPIATPHLFTGCKIAITFAVIGAVIGEFVAAQEGLGYMILMSTAQSQTPLAFAAIILLPLSASCSSMPSRFWNGSS